MSQWLNRLLLVWTLILHVSFNSESIKQMKLGVCHYNETEDDDSEKADSNIIYLLTMLPYPQPEGKNKASSFQPAWAEGPAVLPAAELAVEDINKDPNMLPGCTVKLINIDGGCNVTTTTVINFMKHAVNERVSGDEPVKRIVGIIGPTCSESAITVSSITGRGGQLALPSVHISSSAELEDRDKYPYSFGVTGSPFQIVNALFSLIRYNGWDKVALLYDDSRASYYATKRLREKFLNQSFIIFYSAVYDTFFPLDSLKESEAKIIAITTTLVFAQKIMCIAKYKGMHYPNYQWIIVGHSYEEFLQYTKFRYNGRLHECNWIDPKSGDNILEKQLFIHFRLVTDTNQPLISNSTLQQIIAKYYHYINVYNNKSACPFPIIPNIWAGTVYDAVWALLLALNITLPDGVGNFLKDPNTVDKLKKNFQYVHFNGMSGYIEFSKDTGFVQRLVDIVQVHNGSTELVGSINGNSVSFKNITLLKLPESRYETVNYYLAAILVFIEVVLLIATAIVHIVTLLNKKYPPVKASSPALNQLFFLGCYILGVVAIVYIVIMKALALPNHIVADACHALLVWLVPIAITLSYGILIAKTWRIYRIFIHFQEPGPLISNKALITIVLLQLSIDVIIGTAWTVVSPITLRVVREQSYMNEHGETILPRQCVFTNVAYWMIVLGGYKSLQMLALLVLCLLTRSIRNRRFSTDSLSRASYLGLLLITVTFPLYAILWYTNAAVHVDFVVLCFFFSGNGFVFLVFVLFPPVLPIFLQAYPCKLI